jgi:hypothetical protein
MDEYAIRVTGDDFITASSGARGACLLMSQEGVAYLPSLHRVMHIDGGNAGRLRVHLNIDAGGKA